MKQLFENVESVCFPENAVEAHSIFDLDSDTSPYGLL